MYSKNETFLMYEITNIGSITSVVDFLNKKMQIFYLGKLFNNFFHPRGKELNLDFIKKYFIFILSG